MATQPTQTLDQIRTKYAGKIAPGVNGKDYERHAALMQSFLDEWEPVGKTVDQLESIVGPPTSRQGASLRYGFENGFSGRGWEFRTEAGRITEVRKYYIN